MTVVSKLFIVLEPMVVFSFFSLLQVDEKTPFHSLHLSETFMLVSPHGTHCSHLLCLHKQTSHKPLSTQMHSLFQHTNLELNCFNSNIVECHKWSQQQILWNFFGSFPNLTISSLTYFKYPLMVTNNKVFRKKLKAFQT